jgi:uncharacterized membrane protein
MFNRNQENYSSELIDLTHLFKFDIIYISALILALLDLGTTTYGITKTLDIKGVIGIIVSFALGLIFLWVMFVSKYKLSPAIGSMIRNIPVKTEQKPILDFIPSVITILFGCIFLIVDFWTSLQGVDALIHFNGALGFTIKCFAVFALVLSTGYLIYLHPKNTDDGDTSDE